MLIPRRVKHRKQHHPNRHGAAKGGTTIAFGDYGIQALELTGGGLETEVEELLLGLTQLALEVDVVQVVELMCCRHQKSPVSRLMKRHFMGSLCIARRMASRATSSGTPESLNMMRPGLTLATHHSGEPLPEPIRVSAGFLVSGRSG